MIKEKIFEKLKDLIKLPHKRGEGGSLRFYHSHIQCTVDVFDGSIHILNMGSYCFRYSISLSDPLVLEKSISLIKKELYV